MRGAFVWTNDFQSGWKQAVSAFWEQTLALRSRMIHLGTCSLGYFLFANFTPFRSWSMVQLSSNIFIIIFDIFGDHSPFLSCSSLLWNIRSLSWHFGGKHKFHRISIKSQPPIPPPPLPKKNNLNGDSKNARFPTKNNYDQLCMQLLRSNVFVLTRLPHSCRETAGGSPPAAAIRKAPSTTKRFTRMSTWWPLFGQS